MYFNLLRNINVPKENNLAAFTSIPDGHNVFINPL